ncbi:MAG: peptidoglycan DD-metalloendopeptidase family protein [Clostridia bacterium]
MTLNIKNERKILNFKNIIAIFLTIFVICSTCTSVFGNKLSEYNNELQNVKKQERENSKKLTGLEQLLAQYMYDIADIDGKMGEYQGELATLNDKIKIVNTTLSKHESDLQNTSQIYNSSQELYESRLRSIYENGMPTMWDILFSSKGISDFLSRMNIYESVLEYDKSLVNNMEGQKEYIDFIKKDIGVQKLQLEQLKYDVEKSTNALNDTLLTKQNKVKELETSKSELKANSQALVRKRQEALKNIDDEVDKIIAEQTKLGNTSTAFAGGNFSWPVPGFSIITTRFGQIYNLVNPAGSAHTGADVAGAGIYGSPIVAIETGKVTTATYSNYGYGNYIMINHGSNGNDGKNYISLYGHQSALAAKVGDIVQKGQVIGYVGSTGNSTGPHLHFEIRINGKISDPLVQYPGIKFVYR